jgi:hypothetical protein
MIVRITSANTIERRISGGLCWVVPRSVKPSIVRERSRCVGLKSDSLGARARVCQDSGEGDAFCDGGSAIDGDHRTSVAREAGPCCGGAVSRVCRHRYFGLRRSACRNQRVGGLVQRRPPVQLEGVTLR